MHEKAERTLLNSLLIGLFEKGCDLSFSDFFKLLLGSLTFLALNCLTVSLNFNITNKKRF